VGNDIGDTPGRTDETSVLLSLNYNLYRGGADTAEQRKRASVVQESKTFLDRVRRQVIDNLHLALSADRGIAGQIPYLDRHARRALETVELYREEYLLQQRDLIDVLDAENELNNALRAQSEAGYELMAARYRVREGVGTLFDALDLTVEMDGNDLRIANLTAAGIDTDQLSADQDGDGVLDKVDQCDNSPSGAIVAANGCVSQPQMEIGIQAVDLTFEVVDDVFTTEPGRAVMVKPSELIANDRVSARDGPELRAYGQAEHGSVTLDGAGNLVYTPKPLFIGEDRFEYTIGDRRGRRASGLVRVDVGTTVPGMADTEASDTIRLYFEYKKLSFTASSAPDFDAVVVELQERPELRVEVNAYTDNVGSAAYNRRLSRYRADAVSQMLQVRGIDASRIVADGRGEQEPIADNATEEGRALNRRVELTLRAPRGG
jgi:outer membrane protein OmpA-like peptidoglycan-associated protein